jgi:hypothetical protein
MKILILTILALFPTLICFADEGQPEPDNQPVISKGKYVTGGVLASTLGFGIGHAVQGRYLYKGLIFTATELTGLVLVANSGCSSSRHANARSSFDKGDCDDEKKVQAGLALWLGFHVWEIVDAWTGARVKSAEPKYSVMVVPTKDATLLTAVWTFR